MMDLFESAAVEAVSSLTWEEAVRRYRDLLARYPTNPAQIVDEADTLINALNGGTHFGVAVHGEGWGWMLDAWTSARPGTVPSWGQSGTFPLTFEGRALTIDVDGFMDLMSWSGAIGWDLRTVDGEPWEPFTGTGYRSMLDHSLIATPGVTVDEAVTNALTAYAESLRAPKSKAKKRPKLRELDDDELDENTTDDHCPECGEPEAECCCELDAEPEPEPKQESLL